jgi:CRP-like cAMP-binding protein
MTRPSLEEADRSALLGVGCRTIWERTELWFRAGDQVDHAIVPIDGFVKIHLSSADGAEVVLDLCGPRDPLGVAARIQRRNPDGGTRRRSSRSRG